MYFFEGKCKKRYNHLNQSTPKDHLNPFYQKKEAISFETAPFIFTENLEKVSTLLLFKMY